MLIDKSIIGRTDVFRKGSLKNNLEDNFGLNSELVQSRLSSGGAGPNCCKTCSVYCVLEQPREDNASAGPITPLSTGPNCDQLVKLTYGRPWLWLPIVPPFLLRYIKLYIITSLQKHRVLGVSMYVRLSCLIGVNIFYVCVGLLNICFKGPNRQDLQCRSRILIKTIRFLCYVIGNIAKRKR